MNYLKQKDFFIKQFGGDLAAVALCGAVPTLLNNRHKEKYQDANLWLALFDIPSNPLYRAHRDYLEPIVKGLILDWQIADAVESPAVALGLRQSSSISFVLAVLYCLRGHQAVIEQGSEIATFMHGELDGSCVDLRTS